MLERPRRKANAIDAQFSGRPVKTNAQNGHVRLARHVEVAGQFPPAESPLPGAQMLLTERLVLWTVKMEHKRGPATRTDVLSLDPKTDGQRAYPAAVDPDGL